MQNLLIELQYFGTISWYLHVLRYETVFIEAHENFEKSTYRNRCCIAGPDGKLRLTIPLLHGRSQRARYTDVKIDYSVNWQKNHWQSLCSCYRNSPYFEYYEDRFGPLFHAPTGLLFDFNLKLLRLLLELLEIEKEIQFTSSYEKEPVGMDDFRSEIRPSKADENFLVVYTQVFQERTGFLPDLSIADLLFNKGPHSKEALLSAIHA